MKWQPERYLKFANEKEGTERLAEAFGVNADGLMAVDNENQSVTVLGVLYRDDTVDGAAPVARDGYHVNMTLKTDIPACLLPYLVEVANPVVRAWRDGEE